jgi:hypothetical protein
LACSPRHWAIDAARPAVLVVHRGVYAPPVAEQFASVSSVGSVRRIRSVHSIRRSRVRVRQKDLDAAVDIAEAESVGGIFNRRVRTIRKRGIPGIACERIRAVRWGRLCGHPSITRGIALCPVGDGHVRIRGPVIRPGEVLEAQDLRAAAKTR